MKTFQEFITEKWVVDINKSTQRGNFPIYENPSSKDLVDLRKSGLTNDIVRFAAINANKKLYVWSGMGVIHDEAIYQLVSKKVISRVDHNNLNQSFCGECRLIGGRLSFAKNDGMDSYFGDIIGNIKKRGYAAAMDSSFIPDPYDEPSDLMDDLPEIISRYKWVGKFIDDYDIKSSPAILLRIKK